MQWLANTNSSNTLCEARGDSGPFFVVSSPLPANPIVSTFHSPAAKANHISYNQHMIHTINFTNKKMHIPLISSSQTVAHTASFEYSVTCVFINDMYDTFTTVIIKEH